MVDDADDDGDLLGFLYRKALKTNPNIVQPEASRRIQNMYADGLALHSGECWNRYPVWAIHQLKRMTNISCQ